MSFVRFLVNTVAHSWLPGKDSEMGQRESRETKHVLRPEGLDELSDARDSQAMHTYEYSTMLDKKKTEHGYLTIRSEDEEEEGQGHQGTAEDVLDPLADPFFNNEPPRWSNEDEDAQLAVDLGIRFKNKSGAGSANSKNPSNKKSKGGKNKNVTAAVKKEPPKVSKDKKGEKLKKKGGKHPVAGIESKKSTSNDVGVGHVGAHASSKAGLGSPVASVGDRPGAGGESGPGNVRKRSDSIGNKSTTSRSSGGSFRGGGDTADPFALYQSVQLYQAAPLPMAYGMVATESETVSAPSPFIIRRSPSIASSEDSPVYRIPSSGPARPLSRSPSSPNLLVEDPSLQPRVDNSTRVGDAITPAVGYKSTNVALYGVSLSVLQKLRKDHPGLLTEQLCNIYIKAATRLKGCSYVQMLKDKESVQVQVGNIKAVVAGRATAFNKSAVTTPAPPPSVAPATCFISHAWSCSFDDVVDCVEQYEKTHPNTYYWFDVLSRNQHTVGQRFGIYRSALESVNSGGGVDQTNGAVSDKRIDDKVDMERAERPQSPQISVDTNFEWWCSTVKEAFLAGTDVIALNADSPLPTFSLLLIMTPWNRPVPLTRAWCLYELLIAIHAVKARSGRSKKVPPQALLKYIHVGIPSSEHFSVNEVLRRDFGEFTTSIFASLDLEKADSTSSSDKELILAAMHSEASIMFGSNSGSVIRAIGDRVSDDNGVGAASRHNNDLSTINNSDGRADGNGNTRSAQSDDKNVSNSGTQESTPTLSEKHEVSIPGGPSSTLIHTPDTPVPQSSVFTPGHTTLADLMKASLRYAYMETCIRLAEEAKEAKLLYNMGMVARDYGELDKALKMFKESNAVAITTLGENHRSTAATYNAIGLVLDAQGEHAQAIPYYERSLAIKISTVGESHVETANTYGNMGKAYFDKCDFVHAVQCYEKSLAIFKAAQGEMHRDTALCLGSLGNSLFRKTDYESALRCYEECLSIITSTSGEMHPDTTRTYMNLGNTHLEMSDYDRAIEYYHKALANYTATLGPNHPETLVTHLALGNAHLQKGDDNQALDNFIKCQQYIISTHGKDHVETASLWHNMGTGYLRKGDYDTALEHLEKALAIRLTKLTDRHIDTALTYNAAADAYLQKGLYILASVHYEKCLPVRKAMLTLKGASGSERFHPDLARIYNNLAVAYRFQGQNAVALKQYFNQLSVLRGFYGEMHADTAAAYSNIGGMYEDMGDIGKALEYYEKCLPICIATLGESHVDTGRTYSAVALMYKNKGDLDKSLQLYNKSESVFIAALGQSHPDLAPVYNAIGSIYMQKGNFASALLYYGKDLAITIASVGENHPDTARTYSAMGNAYMHSLNRDKALEYHNKDLSIKLATLGENHPSTAITYNNLGLVYENSREREKALEMYSRALKIGLDSLGEEHAHTKTFQRNTNRIIKKIEERKQQKEQQEQLQRKGSLRKK